MSSIAIQAARLRLTTTQKWVDNFEIILQNAQQQVTASKMNGTMLEIIWMSC